MDGDAVSLQAMDSSAPEPSLRMLVVDDNPRDRVTTIRVLRQGFQGATLSEVGDERDWKRVLAQPDYDVVVMDCRLRGSLELEVLRELHGSWPDVPVILLTGSGDDALARSVVRQGLDEYLPKSEDGYTLLAPTIRFTLERARHRQALRQSEERFAYLARSSAVLGASLDESVTVERVVELAVPRLGAWAAVYLAAEGGPTLSSLAHRDCTRVTELRALLTALPGASVGPLRVFRTGELELLPPPRNSEASRMNEAQALLGHCRCSSLLTLPLKSHTRVRGVLVLATAPDEPPFAPADLELARELAHRAEPAIENARLFAAAQVERARAEEANRLKDEFLATVSHELRTPLTTMLGWMALLREEALPPEKRIKAIATIERNARSQAQLIEDLLDVSCIMTGKLRLEVTPLRLAPLVEAAADSVRPVAEAKGIPLQLTVDPDVVLMGDPTRLQQVVWNLLSNAVKFTPRGGRVQLMAHRRDSALVLTVADTGQGIAPSFLPHVFERFRQAEGSFTRRHGGLGLGLAIVRHVVELHGGSVEASSGGEGLGATFRVQLPLSVPLTPSAVFAPIRTDATRAGSIRCPPELAGLKVLLVLDEEDARDFFSALLERCQAEARVAGSAVEGLKTLKSWRPHVLVADLGMPGEDSFDFIARVRGLPATEGGRTPAIALTAYARVEDRTRALLAGFTARITKPVEPTELLALIAAVSRDLRTPG